MAMIEARNGRRDRAEKAFCDASGMLETRPTDRLILERMLLALAAALLLESRHDLVGMNARYGEARSGLRDRFPHVLVGHGDRCSTGFRSSGSGGPGRPRDHLDDAPAGSIVWATRSNVPGSNVPCKSPRPGRCWTEVQWTGPAARAHGKMFIAAFPRIPWAFRMTCRRLAAERAGSLKGGFCK